jgi:signal transduction histidine kinase
MVKLLRPWAGGQDRRPALKRTVAGTAAALATMGGAHHGGAHRSDAAAAGKLLDMSRIQAGMLEPRRSLTQVSGLVASVAGDLVPSPHGHSLTRQVPAGLPPVDADITLISRVLANLVTFVEAHGQRIYRLTVPGG